MKPLSSWVAVLILLCLTSLADSSARKINPEELQAVPDGNYLLTVELNGSQQRLNLKVSGNKAKCAKSSDPSLAQVEGQFQRHHEGAFLARFRGGLGSQLWIFRPDGSAAVREVPDRGEQQSAVPVKGDSIEVPRGK